LNLLSQILTGDIQLVIVAHKELLALIWVWFIQLVLWAK
jgi:hypothetical protein